MMKKVLGCLLGLCAFVTFSEAQPTREKWVDSVFQTMSVADKIGQLFMVSISPDADEDELEKLERKIKSDNIGGVSFKPGSLTRQIRYTQQFHAASEIPLLVGVEGTSGIGNPGDSLNLKFPVMLAQGAIANDSLIHAMATELGKAYKSLGININFINANAGAVDDTKTDAFYAENRFTVSDKILSYWKGIESQGILACARDFPIHAVKVTEVQKGMPAVELSVDSLETYPFRTLFKNGLPAIMAAGTDLPLFYTEKKTAIKNIFSGNALSASFAGNWIKKNTSYHGVIFIDADELRKGSAKLANGEGELFAFQAGNDIQVVSTGLDAAIRKMKRFFKKEKEYRGQLDSTVKRILGLKYDAGLFKKPSINPEQVFAEMAEPELKLLKKKLYRSSITVVKNETSTIPIQALDERQFTFISADDSVRGDIVATKIAKYINVSVIHANEKKGLPNFSSVVKGKQLVIAAVFPGSKEETIQRMLSSLSLPDPHREVIICDFGSAVFRNFAQFFPTVISGYSDDKEMLQTIPEIIFGGRGASGILPITYGQIPAGTSVNTEPLSRLTYSFPEEAGIDSKTLDKIESIAQEAIEMKATPGCHVLVAKDGKVIYEKSFGYLTYENQEKVTDQTVYDLASVTKVAATLQTVMFMYDKGLIDLNKKASFYLPELKNSNKEDYTIKDILTHQAGLWPGLPFWAQTMKDTVYLPEYYNHTLSAKYPYVVADKLYASTAMKDSLWNWIIKARVREKPARTPYDYRYSDMGFYMMQHLAEKMLNQPIEDFLQQNLYEPLGATSTDYLPLLKFPLRKIAPTENDKLFRKALLIGTVHDQGAAMQGGVAGHAGLFSNANDLAKLGQMLLQEGQYGGTHYYRPEVVRLFTAKQFETSRRGLGWDKPVPGDWNGPTSYYSSGKTFGHTGFTGTCIWVDPEFNLVYIFLSNRVHPDMTNNKLLTSNIRSRIQDVIYQAIFNYCKTAGGEPAVPVSPSVQALGRSQ
jgi:CubicO group peptidase (beta-lactamase class C family)/beta-glucosidase-like glycosyl hydrolase